MEVNITEFIGIQNKILIFMQRQFMKVKLSKVCNLPHKDTYIERVVRSVNFTVEIVDYPTVKLVTWLDLCTGFHARLSFHFNILDYRTKNPKALDPFVIMKRECKKKADLMVVEYFEKDTYKKIFSREYNGKTQNHVAERQGENSL